MPAVPPPSRKREAPSPPPRLFPPTTRGLRVLAAQAVAGAPDANAKADALALFVYGLLRYEDAAGRSVFEAVRDRRGRTAPEFANLYTTLARAVALPARTRVGLAYRAPGAEGGNGGVRFARLERSRRGRRMARRGSHLGTDALGRHAPATAGGRHLGRGGGAPEPGVPRLWRRPTDKTAFAGPMRRRAYVRPGARRSIMRIPFHHKVRPRPQAFSQGVARGGCLQEVFLENPRKSFWFVVPLACRRWRTSRCAKWSCRRRARARCWWKT